MIEAGNLSGASWWAAAAVSPGQRPISGLATPSKGPALAPPASVLICFVSDCGHLPRMADAG